MLVAERVPRWQSLKLSDRSVRDCTKAPSAIAVAASGRAMS